MKKTKNVLFRVQLEGQGIVNFDSTSQKEIMLKTELSKTYSKAENAKFAKKVFTRDEKTGEISYKVKISSDSLRHAIFEDDTEFLSSLAMYADPILANFIASPMALVRGYLFAPPSATKKPTLRRKSALTITDAIQSNDAQVFMETYSRGGDCEMDKDGGYARSSTSFFTKESIGEIEYAAKGNISIRNLQFISSDPIFDRIAVPSDWCQKNALFDQIMTNNYGENYGKLGYYAGNSLIYTKRMAESGIMLAPEIVEKLVKDALKKLYKMSIVRANGFAKIKKLEVMLLSEDDKDSMPYGNNEDWITINSVSDIDKLEINPSTSFYTEVDKQDVTSSRGEINKVIFKAKKAAKDSEDAKNAEKASKSEEKND